MLVSTISNLPQPERKVSVKYVVCLADTRLLGTSAYNIETMQGLSGIRTCYLRLQNSMEKITLDNIQVWTIFKADEVKTDCANYTMNILKLAYT